jgi:HEAT repeat protein
MSLYPELENLPTQELIQLVLTEKDRNIRFRYERALWNRNNREVFEAAKYLCFCNDDNEKQLGASLLGILGGKKNNFSSNSIEVLLQMLKKEVKPCILMKILNALRSFEDSRKIILLARFKNHPINDIRCGVISALSNEKDSPAIDIIIELSADPDTKVRRWATMILGSIKSDTSEIREALFQRLLDEDSEADDDIYGEALVGLAKRKDERAISPLIQVLSSDYVGILAIEASIEFADPRLYPTLSKLETFGYEEEYTIKMKKSLLKEAKDNCKNQL